MSKTPFIFTFKADPHDPQPPLPVLSVYHPVNPIRLSITETRQAQFRNTSFVGGPARGAAEVRRHSVIQPK